MARGSSRQGRKFEWARSVGATPGDVQGNVAIGAVDLLQPARAAWGAGYLRGATVMTVKGWARPYGGINTRPNGIIGVRVCNYADFEGVTINQTPGGPQGSGADWMGYLPFDVHMAAVEGGPNVDTATIPATWNLAASVWAIDIQSARPMEEPGYTLGLFWSVSDILDPADPAGVASLDWNLSIGLKLA